MPVGYETSQPIGHHQFCIDRPAECAVRSSNIAPVALTEALWVELLHVNNVVNDAIAPATDEEMYGVPEAWVYPALQGDCEDYVLLKRRILHEQGWALSALLITVVIRPDGQGHAVLTVRTDRGDFVLDNLHPEVRLWSEAPYQFIKRQSDRHTGRWVAIETGGGAVRFVGE